MTTHAARVVAVLLAAAALSHGVAAASSRPSFLLLVIDTVRVDAVSAYGSISSTTPELDALASEGLLYRRAYAPSPWTLPSHATLFTGLGVDEHRTGMPGRGVLSADVPTLAGILADAGYQTAAISENAIVSDLFGMLRGFQYQRSQKLPPKPARTKKLDALAEVGRWLANREPTQPYLLFVNLFEPHAPYEIRDENRFLPEDADPASVRRRASRPQHLLCGGVPSPERVAIQRGLYLGDVAAADRTAGAIVDLLRRHGESENLIIVATSDHGELFGEGGLMGHEFSLHGALLRVPLIVHGLDGAPPAVVERGVGLIDVAPSILRWAGLAVPSELPGVPLPEANEPGDQPRRGFYAAYSDAPKHSPQAWEGGARKLADNRLVRQFCGPSDPVFGAMASITRHPYKFRWYEKYDPELYDLRWDPQERSNQAAHRPDLVAAFGSEIEAFVAATGLVGAGRSDSSTLSPEALDALRRLGYVE